jgi:hypothetical protein
MSTGTPNNLNDQEIDLSVISKKISGFFEGITTSIFKGILFVKKHSIIFIALFLFGAVGGYFLDKAAKVYDHQIIVSPNFGSVDYLYNKIDLLDSKIKAGDTLFLKSIGIQNPKKILQIEVEPIVDIYTFVNDKTNTVNNAQNSQNFELVKLLSEDGDIKKVVKDNLTSKNYAHHKIHITTDGLTNDKSTIEPILNYLNKNDYLETLQKAYFRNINDKINKNEEIIRQIDGLLNGFAGSSTNNQKSDKLVYYNENTQLNEIIQTKNGLVAELGTQRMDLINLDKVIKTNSSVLNVRNTKGLNNKLKLILPIVLIGLFIFIRFFLAFYKMQSLKAAQNIA